MSTTSRHLQFKEPPRESDLGTALFHWFRTLRQHGALRNAPVIPYFNGEGMWGVVWWQAPVSLTSHIVSLTLSASSLFKFPCCQDTLAAPRHWLVSCGNCSRYFLYEVTCLFFRFQGINSVSRNSMLYSIDFCKLRVTWLRVPRHVPWPEWVMPWFHLDSSGYRRLEEMGTWVREEYIGRIVVAPLLETS